MVSYLIDAAIHIISVSVFAVSQYGYMLVHSDYEDFVKIHLERYKPYETLRIWELYVLHI